MTQPRSTLDATRWYHVIARCVQLWDIRRSLVSQSFLKAVGEAWRLYCRPAWVSGQPRNLVMACTRRT